MHFWDATNPLIFALIKTEISWNTPLPPPLYPYEFFWQFLTIIDNFLQLGFFGFFTLFKDFCLQILQFLVFLVNFFWQLDNFDIFNFLTI